MSYSSRTRDRYRLLVIGATGTAVAASIVGTGWLVGAVAEPAQSPTDDGTGTTVGEQPASPQTGDHDDAVVGPGGTVTAPAPAAPAPAPAPASRPQVKPAPSHGS